MGLFRKEPASESQENRLFRLESKNDELDRELRGLRLEYIELYDKVSHQMSRMSRRYDRAKKAEEIPEDVNNSDSPSEDGDPISAKILARRQRISQPI